MTKPELLRKLKEAGLSDFTANVAVNEVDKAGLTDTADDKLVARLADRLGGQTTGGAITNPTNDPINETLYALDAWQKQDLAPAESAAAKADAKNKSTSGNPGQDQATAAAAAAAQARLDAGKGTADDASLASAFNQQQTSDLPNQLAQLLGHEATAQDVEKARDVLARKLGLSSNEITDAFLSQRLKQNDQTIKTALIADDPFSRQQTIEITDRRTGEKYSVGSAAYDAVTKAMPGYGTFTGLQDATSADSIRKGWQSDNWYGLFAHSWGLDDPNADYSGNLNGPKPAQAAPADPDTLKVGFVRQQLIAEGKLPAKRPTGTKVLVHPIQALWDDPRGLVDDAWWQSKQNEFNDYAAGEQQRLASTVASNSDRYRLAFYQDKQPLFDANLNKYGQQNALAAIVATHDQAMADKMMTGGLTDEELLKVTNEYLKGTDPKDAGFLTDNLQRYSADYKKAQAGPTKTIIQPNRDKIAEGFREMYRSWFQVDPTDDELKGLIDQVANEYVSAQVQNREGDSQSTAIKAIRDTSIYGQLYGNKAPGLTEEQYIGGFQKAGSDLLGGQAASQAAVQAGMRSGNTQTTAAITASEQGTWQNSAWLERVSRLADLANQLT